MPAMTHPKNKKQNITVIVGLGATGLSAARFLARHGEAFAVTDSRTCPPGLTDPRASFRMSRARWVVSTERSAWRPAG